MTFAIRQPRCERQNPKAPLELQYLLVVFQSSEASMPSRARLDEFIAAVESGDHAGAIERFYTEDASGPILTFALRLGGTFANVRI